MVSQRNLVAVSFNGGVVEDATTEARTHGASSLARRGLGLNDRIGVLLDDAERNTNRPQVFRQNMLWKTGLLLIQVYCQQVKLDWRISLQVAQQGEHGIAVFATAQADHYPIAICDHIEIADGSPHTTLQSCRELINHKSYQANHAFGG